MSDNFRFIETKETTGLVDDINHLAKNEKISLNKYVGRVLKKHVEEAKTDEENQEGKNGE